MKTFKPMLATDATKELDNIKYPKYASLKLDGIRCIFHPELGMVSRSLKQIPNKQLQEKFRVLTEDAQRTGIIRDGELYSHKLTFQEITSACMTKDFYDMKTQKKILKQLDGDKIATVGHFAKLLGNIEFCQFDSVDPDRYYTPLKDRINHHVPEGASVQFVTQNLMHTREEIDSFFKTALDTGYEGLILRDPNSPYKYGRSTLKEEFMLKVKPFETEDLEVINVIERMENLNESFKNELNQSTKRNTKEDKQGTGIASCFEVIYNNLLMKVTLTGTEDFRREIWENKEKYIGRIIEVKGMKIGAKDVLRHPTFMRFRKDRD